MNFKPKSDHRSNHHRSSHRKDRRCPRLITKLTALVTSLTLSLSLLPTTALAADPFIDKTGGGVVDSTAAAALYGFNGHSVSWKVDAYVSTNPTGKIDVENDDIDSDYLKWVGAVIYDNFNAVNGGVYLCTDYTNDKRSSLQSGKITLTDKDGGFLNTQWALPHVTKVTKKNTPTYNLTDGKVVAHVVTTSEYNPLDFPTEIDEITSTVYENQVRAKFHDNEYITTILSHINDSLDGELTNTVLNLGACKQGTPAGDRLDQAIAEKGAEALNLLLPNSVDPSTNKNNAIVQWCFILTPVMSWQGLMRNNNRVFWECYIGDTLTYIGSTKGDKLTTFGLDAYSTAQYNKTTQVMYNQTNSASTLAAIGEAGFAVRIQEENGVYLACQKWDKNYFYKAYGKLYAEAMNGLGFVYQAAYNTFSENKWCGIYSANNFLAQTESLSHKYFVANTSDFAKYGGIGVFVSKFTDPGIPVYYYVYDPDHPDEPPTITTSSYTPKDGTTTFTPSTDTGLPADCTVVAMEFA